MLTPSGVRRLDSVLPRETKDKKIVECLQVIVSGGL